jgi:hypothetical protein
MSAPTDESESLAQRVCRRVLRTAQTVDKDASLASVARLDGNAEATLVRVRAGHLSTNPASLAAALRAAWPLAHVAVVENYIEGTYEAQVVVPAVKEQRELAHAAVAQRAWAGRMATVGMALLWASAATFGGIVVAHLAL